MDKAQTKADKNQTAEEKIHHSKNTNQHGGKRIPGVDTYRKLETDNFKRDII